MTTNGRTVVWSSIAPAIFLFILPITHTTPLRVTCLVLSLVSVVVAYRIRGSATRPPVWLGIAIAYWFCVCLAASYASIEPEYSWGEFRNEVISPTVAFLVFYGLTDSERALRRWTTVLLASFAVIVPIALVSYALGVGWGRAGLVGDRNAFSTYIVLIVPFLFFQWIESAGRPRAWRVGIAIAVPLALVAGACTQNRNMWFSIAIEAIVFATLVYFRQPADARRRLRVRYLGVGVLGAVIFVGALAYVIQQKAIVSNTSTEEQARFDRDPRFEIWAYAAGRIGERPWFGHGYGRGILRSDFRTHFADPLKWHGHNVVVDYVMEAGVFGGVAIVGLFAAFAWRAGQLYRSRHPVTWPIGAWTLTMLVGISLKVMTDDILVRDNALLFWSVLGMGFGLASRLLPPARASIRA